MNETTAPTTIRQKPDFATEIDIFIDHVNAIGESLRTFVVAFHSVTQRLAKELAQYEKENCEVEEKDGSRIVRVPNALFKTWRHKSRNSQQFQLAGTLLPRSLLISIVSQYDAYLGRILRTVFLRKPEMLYASDKKISFEALNQFSTMDAAREYILEKEVESVLRSSHSDQFRWMESSFGVPLTKGLKSWPIFIEVTERRNLFVHTNGVVSTQYLSICNLHKCTTDKDIKEGSRLEVPSEYFESARDCIFEIGVKLGHVLWRKLFPDERDTADAQLSRVTYDLIDSRRYELAKALLDFATTEIKKYSSEMRELMFVVNRAQAYRWSGDSERATKIMKAVDWSAKGDEFRLGTV